MLIRIVCILLLFQENLMTKSLKKWLFSERTKSRKVLFLWTLYFRNSHKLLLSILIWLCNPFILVPCIFHGTHLIYFTYYRSSHEKNFKVIHLTRWLPTTSILVVIERIYRYQFKSNYLKNHKFFATLNFQRSEKKKKRAS